VPAGNSIGFDRAAIVAHDPRAFGRLHHHVNDLSALNEIVGACEPTGARRRNRSRTSTNRRHTQRWPPRMSP
jgi:oligoribonuclease (3'-5' exoribonuclease)